MPLLRYADAEPRTDLPWIRRRTMRGKGEPVPARPAGAAASTSGATPTRSTGGAAATSSVGTAPAAGAVPGARTTPERRGLVPPEGPTPTPARGTPLDLSGPSTTPAAAPRPAVTANPLDLDAPASPPAPSRPVSPANPLDLDDAPAPAGASPSTASASSTSLDLSEPAPAGRPAGGPASSTSLDLSGGAPARAASSSGTSGATSLDLSGSVPPATAPRARRPRPSASRGDLVLGYEPVVVRPGPPTVLTAARPSVALTRVQSGTGVLSIRSATSDAVGDLRLAAAYELTDGRTSLVSHARDLPSAPPRAQRPSFVSGRDGGQELLRLDLRKVTLLRRMVVLAFSPTGAALAWGGTLVVETTGHARVHVPLDRSPAPGVLVALSVYNVGGRLVLRSENALIAGTLRDACLAYGFAGITWMDPQTPLV